MQSTTPPKIQDVSTPQPKLPLEHHGRKPAPFFALARDAPIGPGPTRRAIYTALALFCTPPSRPGNPGITKRLTHAEIRRAAGDPNPKTLDRHLSALAADGWIAWRRTGRGSVFYVYAGPRPAEADPPMSGVSDPPMSGVSDPPMSGVSVREDMSREITAPPVPPATPADIGEYVRAVERLIIRAQAGNLIRISGADFQTVAGWHADGFDLARIAAEIDRTTARQTAHGTARRVAVRYLDRDLRRPSREDRRIDRLRTAAQSAADAIREDLSK